MDPCSTLQNIASDSTKFWSSNSTAKLHQRQPLHQYRKRFSASRLYAEPAAPGVVLGAPVTVAEARQPSPALLLWGYFQVERVADVPGPSCARFGVAMEAAADLSALR